VRLWSIHPGYLDSKGLVALWREGLLALAVVNGKTKGYRNHPQLERFRRTGNPSAAVRGYLWHVHQEALRRGYRFDRRKIGRIGECPALQVTRGQLRFELAHLKGKLLLRDKERLQSIRNLRTPRPHPSFLAVAGGVESWERIL
jgi:hypothetical protein